MKTPQDRHASIYDRRPPAVPFGLFRWDSHLLRKRRMLDSRRSYPCTGQALLSFFSQLIFQHCKVAGYNVSKRIDKRQCRYVSPPKRCRRFYFVFLATAPPLLCFQSSGAPSVHRPLVSYPGTRTLEWRNSGMCSMP